MGTPFVLPPGGRPGESPPFSRLDEYTFQDLCRDLFDALPGIASCHTYGVRGQGQLGIDLLAYRSDGSGIEVGQCKRYRAFSDAQIRAASQAFWDHWDHWSGCRVKRFILFVACDLETTQQQDEIAAQVASFAKRGIRYEAWGAAQLRNKLRPHRAIVATYFKGSDYWIRDICGPDITPPLSYGGNRALGPIIIQMSETVEALSESVTGSVNHQLDAIRALWREGRRSAATDAIKRLRWSGPAWDCLPSPVQAEAIRLAATMALDQPGGAAHARTLANQARALAPEADESRLLALITYGESGAEAALQLLGDREDLDGVQLRCALLLELGEIGQVGHLLGTVTDTEATAETYRLRALHALASREVPRAQIAIAQALEREPRWFACQFVGAQIDYFSVLCIGALPGQLQSYPDPIGWTLLKRDDASLARLRQGTGTLLDLRDRCEQDDPAWATIAYWLLACLANDPDRQKEASDWCQVLLQRDATDHYAVMCAYARNMTTGLQASSKALMRSIKQRPTINDVISLVCCRLKAGQASKATRLLRDHQDLFSGMHEEDSWYFWYLQCLTHDGISNGAQRFASKHLEGLRPPETKAVALRVLALNDGNWQPLLHHLETSFTETGHAAFLFEACAIKAQLKDWEYVVERAQVLIEACATDASLQLIALAMHNAKQYQACLDLLDRHRHFYPRDRLPSQLRQLRIACKQALGMLSAAAIEAEEVAREAPSVPNLLTLIQIYILGGNLAGAVHTAHQLRAHPDLAPRQALQLADLLAADDLHLAQSFWRRAVAEVILDDEVGSTIGLGFRLGLDREVRPLMERMVALAPQQRGGVRSVSVAEFVQYADERRLEGQQLYQAYSSGMIPVHVYAARTGDVLARVFHSQLSAYEGTPDPLGQLPLLVAHGSRTVDPILLCGQTRWRLYLDTSALLLAAHLGILLLLRGVFMAVCLPPEALQALIRMRAMRAAPQPARQLALEQLSALRGRGMLRETDRFLDGSSDNARIYSDEHRQALFAWAAERGGYVLDFRPDQPGDRDGTVNDTDGAAERPRLCCRNIADALRNAGILSEVRHRQAIEQLGSFSAPLTEGRE